MLAIDSPGWTKELGRQEVATKTETDTSALCGGGSGTFCQKAPRTRQTRFLFRGSSGTVWRLRTYYSASFTSETVNEFTNESNEAAISSISSSGSGEPR